MLSDIGALLADTADGPYSRSTAAGTRLTTIGASFQAEEETTDVVEDKMRQYIEEQLEKRRQDSSSAKRPREQPHGDEQSAAIESAAQQARETAVLQDVAPLLRRSTVLDEKEEESAERWLRGIAEVQLPMEHRMHNVERTEAARARLSHKPSQPSSTQFAALPANFNSNFAHHKVAHNQQHTSQHVCRTAAAMCSSLPCLCACAALGGVGQCDEAAVEAAHGGDGEAQRGAEGEGYQGRGAEGKRAGQRTRRRWAGCSVGQPCCGSIYQTIQSKIEQACYLQRAARRCMTFMV